jgi:AraC-like DNA-binding protein
MSNAQAWLQPCLHPVYARLLCAELRRCGFAPQQILDGTRLDWTALHTDNRFLSFAQFRRLVLRGLELSQCPWLGLRVGASTQLSTHGAPGVLAMASPNVAQALLAMQRFVSLRENLGTFSIEHADNLTLQLHESVHSEDVREYVLGHILAGTLNLLQTVSGQALHSQAMIRWPFAEPPWAHAYRELYPQSTFNAPRLQVQLPLALLDCPSLGCDSEAQRLALRDCEHQLKQLKSGSLSQRIHQRLLACDGRYPSLDQMAAVECMAPRTLLRHLSEEGVNYQQLLDSVREELACWLLLQTPLSVEAIAERLGYQDTSNFSRTFRRWLGVTPRAFRQRAIDDPQGFRGPGGVVI